MGSRRGRGWSQPLGYRCARAAVWADSCWSRPWPEGQAVTLCPHSAALPVRGAPGRPRRLLQDSPAWLLTEQLRWSQPCRTAALPAAGTLFSGCLRSSSRPTLPHCFQTPASVTPAAEQGASSGLGCGPPWPVSVGPAGGAGGRESVQAGLSAGSAVGLQHPLAEDTGAPEGGEPGLCRLPPPAPASAWRSRGGAACGVSQGAFWRRLWSIHLVDRP